MALVALVSLTLTSCLDSNNDDYQYRGGFAKMTSLMGRAAFISGDYTIVPTDESVAALESNGGDLDDFMGHTVYMQYRYNPSVTDAQPDANNQITDVELYAVADIQRTTEIVEQKGAGLPNDSVNTATIIRLDVNESYGIKPYFFDRYTLMLPVNYFINEKLHDFTLMYYADENQGQPTLNLELHHNKHADTGLGMAGSGMTSYEYYMGGYIGFYFMAFDLTDVYYRYGSQPSSVNVKIWKNEYDVDLEGNNTETETVTVTYSEE